MSIRSMRNRAPVTLLLAALMVAALAPLAAGDGGRMRYRCAAPRHGHRVVRMIRTGPLIIERHSDFGALAGFLGGLAVGSVLSNVLPPPPPPVYEYFDPYCDERFATIEAYEEHLDRHRHPCRVDVIEVHGRRCVDSWEWRDGRWRSRDDRDARDPWPDDGERVPDRE